jgi:hypothetical protein
MGAHRTAFSTQPQRRGGVVVGSTGHQILLALRAGGGMTSDQIYERFAHPSQAMCALRRAGLIVTPPNGHKGEAAHLTDAGRALVAPSGPLSRANSLITYCQL